MHFINHFVAKIKIMSRLSHTLFFITISILSRGQDPLTAPLPSKFDGLEKAIIVDHFPSPVYASVDENEPETFFWKHNTSFMSTSDDITILEGGAYIYYNNQWNLRITYSAKELSALFDIGNKTIKAGQPYTFVDNWRRDSQLRGGWAMWYVIGLSADKRIIYGIGLIDTVGQLYGE